ncbi:MAG: hypothetical protein QOH66_1947 [Actinomycetota bacterium]|nr:hypothetical protein [Actinomycetota bacterium]
MSGEGISSFCWPAPAGSSKGEAELEVSDRSGEVVFRAPLARHCQVDETGTLWVRPVVGGYRPEPAQGMPEYAFSLTAARRRGLDPVNVRREGPELILELYSGEVARIRPAGPKTLPELQHWDTFYFLVLTAQEEADLDALWSDSYLGDWA